DPRSDCPITVSTQQNINTIKDLVDDDPHISIDYFATILDLLRNSVDIILKQCLGLLKISSRSIFHDVTLQYLRDMTEAFGQISD
ncbi:unnamed protein product, partial [Rotaria sp. Silwood1]